MAGDGGAARARGKTRLLGVSNVSLEQLVTLHDGATVKPAFVQNRCFASDGLGPRRARASAAEHGIVYQGFSLLTANPRELASAAVRRRRAAHRPDAGPGGVPRSRCEVGMVPLTGTTSRAHMEEDLASFDFELDPAEVKAIEECAVAGRR